MQMNRYPLSDASLVWASRSLGCSVAFANCKYHYLNIREWFRDDFATSGGEMHFPSDVTMVDAISGELNGKRKWKSGHAPVTRRAAHASCRSREAAYLRLAHHDLVFVFSKFFFLFDDLDSWPRYALLSLPLNRINKLRDATHLNRTRHQFLWRARRSSVLLRTWSAELTELEGSVSIYGVGRCARMASQSRQEICSRTRHTNGHPSKNVTARTFRRNVQIVLRRMSAGQEDSEARLTSSNLVSKLLSRSVLLIRSDMSTARH